MITRSDVDEAAKRLAGWVRPTPVLAADPGSLPGPAWFKLEYLQHTGSFKARGALNRLLTARESGELDPRVGIAVASGGNAGIANAYAAAAVGVPATVFVPETAPAVKLARLRALGATVVQRGTEYAVASLACTEFAERTGAVLSHAYDQPAVVAGAGTMALELADQLDAPIDTIVVAVGGGGLAAGLALAGYRLRAHVAPRLLEKLKVSRPEAFRGDGWLLAGDGAVRMAAEVEIEGGSSTEE